MNTKNKIFSSKGMSLVELSFLLPVVFLFIFAGVEFSKSLRMKILAQNLSRELANTLVRECIGQTDTTLMTDCINRYQNTISQILTDTPNGLPALAPGARVYGAIYRKASPTSAVSVVCQGNSTPDSDYPSKIKAGGSGCGVIDAAAEDMNATLNTAPMICVAEVYIPYTAILGFIPGYFRYNPSSFYAATTI